MFVKLRKSINAFLISVDSVINTELSIVDFLIIMVSKKFFCVMIFFRKLRKLNTENFMKYKFANKRSEVKLKR